MAAVGMPSWCSPERTTRTGELPSSAGNARVKRVVYLSVHYADKAAWLPHFVSKMGVEAGLIEKSGSHFSFQSERIGQGREKAVEWLREHGTEMTLLADQIVAAPPKEPPRDKPSEEAA